jgi:hypothetical protein
MQAMVHDLNYTPVDFNVGIKNQERFLVLAVSLPDHGIIAVRVSLIGVVGDKRDLVIATKLLHPFEITRGIVGYKKHRRRSTLALQSLHLPDRFVVAVVIQGNDCQVGKHGYRFPVKRDFDRRGV